MTYFKENEQISMKLKKEQILTNFQEIAFYRSVSNEQISSDFLLDIKRATFDGKY